MNSIQEPPRPTLARRLRRTFDVYDIDGDSGIDAYFASADAEMMGHMFEAVREEVAVDGCFPLMRRNGDEYAIYIMQDHAPAPPRRALAAVLAILTLMSATVAGTLLVHGYGVATGILDASATIWTGRAIAQGALLFGLPLFFIVASKEMAHYFVARRHGLATSPPYLIPLPPPLSFIGTIGGLVNVRTPVPSRAIMIRLGAVGPLAGFAAASFVLAAGLAIGASISLTGANAGSVADGSAAATIAVGTPWLLDGLAVLLGVAPDAPLHPLALAGWVGLFLTALHLLPLAGLSGGLIARGLLARRAPVAAGVALVALVGLGFVWWPWWGVALAAGAAGLVQPQPLNEVTPPDRTAWWLVAAVLVVFALAFTPVPLTL